jgi:glycosyltransferase involved in cell wall biosynthesis
VGLFVTDSATSTPPGSIAVVIPCYRVSRHILEVVGSLPAWVSAIYAVDDACPEKSGDVLAAGCHDPRLRILRHAKNGGVGAATCTGFSAAMADGHEILVKMDGDGQMDAAYMGRLVHAIAQGEADFTKGNRLHDMHALRQMPVPRRIGNMGLTLLTKMASGFWHISDPTNGYIAVHQAALRLVNVDRLSPRYFFESSMLIQLNIIRAVAIDVPIPARYGDEQSSLSIWRALFGFPPRLLRGLAQRIVWRYFIYDVSAVTILLVAGALLTAAGAWFGGYHWVLGFRSGLLQSSGTIGIALLLLILGFQMLLEALLLDVVDKPLTPLSILMHDDRPTTSRARAS